MKTPGAHQEKDIWSKISRQLYLWDASQHTGMLGDTEAEGEEREGRLAQEGS